MYPTEPMRRFASACVAAAVVVVGAGILGLDAMWCLSVATLLLLLAGVVALIGSEQRQYALREEALLEVPSGAADAGSAEATVEPPPPAVVGRSPSPTLEEPTPPPPLPPDPPATPVPPAVPTSPSPSPSPTSSAPRRVPVRFRLPSGVGAELVHLVGDFNGWSRTATPMARQGDAFVVEVDLEPGRTYRYRFLLDGQRWENDWAAERYLPNAFGSEDSVITVGEVSR